MPINLSPPYVKAPSTSIPGPAPRTTEPNATLVANDSVSYTHLDVYKRQVIRRPRHVYI